MRNGAFAVMAAMALGFLGVELTHHEQPAHAAVASAPPADSRADAGPHHRSATCDRALRLIADHWGLFLRPSHVTTTSTEREDSLDTTVGQTKTKQRHTRKSTRDLDDADRLTRTEAAQIEKRFSATGSRVLLVTMPDPIDSDLGIDFDRYLETLPRAFGQRDFVLDRHDLPWPRPSSKGQNTDDRAGARYREQPGLALFRRPLPNSVDDQLLLVLVVGETPVAGVQRLAYRNALLLARHLNGSKATIHVLGPTLSGSVPSLRRGMCEAFSPSTGRDTVVVAFRSTTATSDSNKKALSFGTDGCGQGGRVISVYASATHDDSTLFAGLTTFLHERHFEGPVAILSESTSAYGRLTPDAGGTPIAPQQTPCREPSGAITFECFSFPMQISQLRAAYERERSGSAKGVPTGAATPLELSFGDASGPRDLPPVYSTALAANSADGVLRNTFETIARHKARYLVIVATDMRDRLFLAQIARVQLADVQLVFFDSDVLQTHPDISADLEGVLVVTGYPLFLGKTPGTDSGNREFPTQGTVAIFNGAVQLLGTLFPDPRPPAFVGVERGRWGAFRPRVWVTVVNRLHEWPVASYVPESRAPQSADARFSAGVSQSTSAPPSQLPFRAMAPSLSLPYVLVAIAVVACVVGWLLSACPLSDFQGVDGWDWGARVFVVTARHVPAWVLLGLSGLLTLSLWKGEGHIGAGTALLAAPVFASLVWASPTFIRQSLMSTVMLRRLLCAMQIGMATLITGALAYNAWASKDVVALEDLRLLLPSSGLDIRVPFILLVGAIVVLLITQPVQAIDPRFYRQLNPFAHPIAKPAGPPFVTRSFDVFHDLIGRDLYWTSKSRALIWGAVGLVVFGLLSCAVSLSIFRLTSFEGPLYDVTAKALLTVVGMAIALVALQAFCIWTRIRQLLCRLAWHPIHAAFDRLPSHLAQHLGFKGSLRFPSVSELGFSMEQAGMVANHLDQLDMVHPPQRVDPDAMLGVRTLRARALTESWTKDFRYEIEHSERGLGPGRGIDSVTMDRLLHVSRGLFEMLEAVWDARPLKASRLGGKKAWPEPSKGGEEHAVGALERDMPDEFHAWIRLCEDFAATMTVLYLRCVFVLLKRLLLGVIAATLLLLFAVVSYPFQPRGGLTSWAFGFVVALLVLGIVLIVQTERDPILSHVANTKANKVTLSSQLVTQFGLYVCAPAAILLTTQFPRLRDVLGRLVEPLMRAAQG